MHDLYKLKESLVKELEEYGKSGELTKSSLDAIDKLAHATKNIAKVIECCEEEEYSQSMGRSYGMPRYYMDGEGRSYEDRSYANDGSGNYVRPDGSYRDGGMSYARGRGRYAKRDSMGRYSRSGDPAEELRELMNKVDDERAREEIRKVLDRM